jgi:hypothetical protein
MTKYFYVDIYVLYVAVKYDRVPQAKFFALDIVEMLK